MPLPIATLKSSEVTVNGEVVPFRAMSRAEVVLISKFAEHEDKNALAEIWMLQCGTGCTEDEAKAFRDGNDGPTAGLLVDAIAKLSALSNEAPLQCPDCGFEGQPDAFEMKDGLGNPKSSPIKRSSRRR